MTASKAVGTSARSELAGELRRVSSKLPQSASSSASSQAQANSKSNTSSEGIIDPAITAAAASLLQWVRAHPSLLADHAADVELAFRAEMQSKVRLDRHHPPNIWQSYHTTYIYVYVLNPLTPYALCAM